MVTRAQKGAGQTQTTPQDPTIYFPQDNTTVYPPFVAFGMADLQAVRVVGQLTTGTGMGRDIVQGGLTLPFPQPHRWAIYFNLPDLLQGKKCTLEVYTFGGLDRSKQATKLEQAVGDALISVTVNPKASPKRPPKIYYAPQIMWPQTSSGPYSGSNFAPYGSYSPLAGTITATLNEINGSNVYNASSVYQDTGIGFWCAQFPVISDYSNQYELSVTLTTPGASYTTSAGPYKFIP